MPLLENFIQKLREMYQIYRDKNSPNSSANDIFEYKVNSKYIKIIHTSWGQGSVFCFIDTTNGNVLKAENWNKPDLKNPRGNLFSEQGGLEAITTSHLGSNNYHPHIKYLR